MCKQSVTKKSTYKNRDLRRTKIEEQGKEKGKDYNFRFTLGKEYVISLTYILNYFLFKKV